MRRLGIGILALAVWVAGSTLGAIGGGTAATARSGIIVGKAHAGYTPTLEGKDPITILAVGSGARPGEDVLHSLADSLHVIFIDPATHKASMIGVPRDSYVPIEGHGTGKINSSLFYGGPELLVKTVEQLGGFRIDYWAITTFWGFTDMIDDIGGLTMDVPFAMSDSYARADFQPGVQELSGHDALAFARTRHDLQQGDFGRQENGGRLFLAALAQFQKEYKADQSSLFRWIGAGMRNTDLTALAERGDRPRVHGVAAPGGQGPEPRAARLRPDGRQPLGGRARHRTGEGDLHRRQDRRDRGQEERAAEPHRERIATVSPGRAASPRAGPSDLRDHVGDIPRVEHALDEQQRRRETAPDP